ncbi:MAG: sugar phosphate isomerase/epimerase [Planctomycetaceae bacterium]|nr:sugar phosphate isomerase/epimerase [Planctomycetaceae bacterium]MCP4480644.1 sugar phosphate isomerase/epimerase [Planctomycetaceae bacterium]
MDVDPRVSICQFSTYRWSFYEDVIRYSTLGFESMGLWRQKIDDFGRSAAIDLLYENKMSVSSVHWAGGFTGDGRTFSDSIEDAIESIHLASQVDADCLIIHPGSRNGHTTSNATRLMKSALTQLVPVAADYGVKLAIEPMLTRNAASWTYLERLEDSFELMERFPAQSVGWVFDLYHFGFDAELFETLENRIQRLLLVQLSDRKLVLEKNARSRQGHDSFRLPLGKGEAPIEAWLGKLQGLGYAGKYELEVHGSCVKDLDYFSLLDETIDYLGAPRISEMLESRPVNSSPDILQIDQRQID